MNILNITLTRTSLEPDHRICDMCPCFQVNGQPGHCGLHYFLEGDGFYNGWMRKDNGEIEPGYEHIWDDPKHKYANAINIRPQMCIDEHGE